MVAELAALTVVAIAIVTEALHQRRVRRVARLAFGPTGHPQLWARVAPALRVAALGAVTWGLVTLLILPPKTHRGETLDKNKLRHLLLVLDVSPSMRLEDAGTTKQQSRLSRVSDLLESFFKRSPEPMKISVVAVYNGAKPVVQETLDMDVVRNILNELPMHYAFEVGETKLFDGLEEAARMARGWKPRDATLVLLSDGDTVPATGMPRLPAAIGHVVVIGVGDPRSGGFVDGRHSRQDVATLRQIAVRLGGTYHNGNEKQIPTDTLRAVTRRSEAGVLEQLTRREYALIACACGAAVFAALPWLLTRFGTGWQPGPRAQEAAPANGQPRPEGRAGEIRGREAVVSLP